ncbi:xanthine dehydrogenase family protein molybdopterin-binding subunit [Rhodoplanes sp. Z2-YC6860]|uniref:xanthine dehydrogenase family protein molybdopterin-binding subunit n=1 Tax=Rhodoplanes sp. Z2-YC6860 TaxID=674703 RepID=UPI00078D3569|nr:molybdopterin cofactor-binding domain-containing protein [Rhodoplanes sp. Z2-YC6860]AMN44360.1 Aerobic-type carbon monoxide dehydrogenase, large subunit CoxL/CutL-like protein [Rhodoplanes sp. Z2-YC6860]
MRAATSGIPEISRRTLLGGLGGFALGFVLNERGVEVFEARAQNTSFKASAWVSVATDGTVTLMCPTSEMGQGIYTSLPLIFAEEMDADWSRVRVAQAPVDAVFNNPVHFNSQGVGGSRSMRGYWMPMRLAGARTRQILIANAAARWSVPASEVATEPGKVIHAASGRSMSYGEIASFATVPVDLAALKDSDLKPQANWRLIGRDVPRVEVPGKVNGSAKYGIDVQLPDMLYASVLRPPVATFPHPLYDKATVIGPERVDDGAALAIEGVLKVVKLPHGVAVVGTDYWATVKGKRALKVEWQKGAKSANYDSLEALDEFAATARDPSRSGVTRGNTGDVPAAFNAAAKTFAGEFSSEHVYHAAMEPMNATAWVRGDEVELWSPTQGQTWARDTIVKVLGVPADKVKVHTTMLGGGFGLKTEQLTTVEAVRLSREMGKPVKVIWSREDDVQNGAYRPAAAHRLEAAVDSNGRITGWKHRLVADSVTWRARTSQFEQFKGFDVVVMSGAVTPYNIANKHHEFIHQDRGVPVGYWNANGAGLTNFAIECFIDDIARELGKDPVAIRLEMLSEPRGRRTIEEAAAMAGWGRSREGRALGIAYSDGGEWNCKCAQVAEVSVDRASGVIKVHKIFAAVDPGIVVQPGHLKQQIETSILFGLGTALRERITLKQGEVQEANFYDYELTRSAGVPDIEVKIVDTGFKGISGAGQPGVPPAAPAVANAVAALTGVRLRRMPMLPERVKAAMRS